MKIGRPARHLPLQACTPPVKFPRMFQFRLGSIPVRVHPSHLLTSALLGLLFMGDSGRAGQWPGAALSAEGPERLWATAAYIGSWVFIIFVSVLIHELGHALL